MSITVKDTVTIAAVFLWIGFVSAISFMEAWLKFRAPGVNLSIGLGIGRLVFNALNKMEWIFAGVIIIGFFFSKGQFIFCDAVVFCAIVMLLALQTFWLLPALDVRAESQINGFTLPPSNLHFYYVVMEIIKVASLFVFVIKQFQNLMER